MALSYKHGLRRPPLQTMWYICLTLHTSWFMHKLFVLLLHFLPAAIVDVVAMLFGKRTKWVLDSESHININKMSIVYSV